MSHRVHAAPDGGRALTVPCAVLTVTIWVVPRYSAPNTSPRSGPRREAQVLGADAEDEVARRPASRGRDADSRRRRAARHRRPAARPPRKRRKFIGGEPMKSATNMLAGRS